MCVLICRLTSYITFYPIFYYIIVSKYYMMLKIIGIKAVHGLRIFSSKIELNKKIKEQEDQITQMEAEKDTNIK